MAELNYNVGDYEPSGTGEELPLGKYLCVLEESELKEAQSGKGQYLATVFQVIEGPFSGRKIFHNFNLFHTTPIAERIAREEYRQLADACGKTPAEARDSVRLHNIPLIVGIRMAKKKDGTLERRNYFAPKSAGTADTTAPKSAPASAAPAGDDPPWKRNR